MENYYSTLDRASNIIAPGSRFTISKVIEEAITDVLINRYGTGWANREELFWKCYDFLRKRFKKDSYVGDIPYFYSMYYMLLNIPKVQVVLMQLMRKKRMSKNLKVLDIGCGVGTAAFAIIDLFILLDNLCELNNQASLFEQVTIDSIEGSQDNIRVYDENISYFIARLSNFGDIGKFKINSPKQDDITKCSIEGSYDLVVLSNVLSEIPYNRRKNLVTVLAKRLTPNGDIIMIEPASQKPATELNRLKVEIVNKTDLNCIAPCGVCNNCSQCWSFQTCDICNCELINYIDRLYEKKIKRTKFADYHNNRLKWCYAILSKNCPPDQCTDLSEVYAKSGKSVKVNVIGSNNNGYLVCDGRDNKALLVGNNSVLGYFLYGDFIRLENIRLVKYDTFTINYLPSSSVHRVYESSCRQNLAFLNAKPKNLRYLLKRMWGFDDFREGQAEIIQKALQGEDILGILPTGAGKSLCYQLPALLGSGVSLVVSPLKSLMKDQIANLKSIGFESVDYIDSSKTAAGKKVVLNRLKSGKLKLLYIAPERLQTIDFQQELYNMLKNFPIDYFIIDEAHCASEWGHDFRPSYLKLRDIVTSLGPAIVLAVTATASPRVKEDILNIFKIKAENVVCSYSLDRPEISFKVVLLPSTENKDRYLTRTLKSDLPDVFHADNIHTIHNEGAGIIFTIYAKAEGKSTKPYGTEHVLEIVHNSQIKSELYHSKLGDWQRDLIQESFKRNEFPLLVSTKGFGMGIDKANIRYIIHMCYSNSLEAYYQEAGRSGRDRGHAHSVIIARARRPECIENTNSGIGPSCSSKWECFFTGGFRCDYGMQARFISDNYPASSISRALLQKFYRYLLSESKGRKLFIIRSSKSEASKHQTYLFYFQTKGVILNYATLRYVNNGMMFRVEIDQNLFGNINIGPIIEDIVARLQNFKTQKYNMLESIWEYVSNTTKCRRQMLMDYLDDDVNYGAEGCKFCDIEGISEERTIAVTKSLKIKKLFEEFQVLMQCDEFDYVRTKDLLLTMYAENQHESAKIRAMKHLEDYTDSTVALYFRSIISLKRNKRDAYALNQLVRLANLLLRRSEVKAASNVINDLVAIDEDTAEQALATIDISNLEAAKLLMDKVNTRTSREIISKVLLKNKLQSLNKQLARRI